MTTFAIHNIKGGVGKTSAAVNLAYLSAKDGARTLLWDLDPQGSSSFYFRIRAEVKGGARKLVRGKTKLGSAIRGSDFERLDLVPADFSNRNLDLHLSRTDRPKRTLERLLDSVRREYDHVFLDCAPGISLVSESVFRAADVLLVPTIPTTLSLRTLAQLAQHLKGKRGKGIEVLPFFSMADRRKALHRNVLEAPVEGPFPFLATVVPYASAVERMGLARAPLPVCAPKSRVTAVFRALWRDIQERAAPSKHEAE